jgi:predicted lipoprotein with Yx(FWY)xxD motif
MGKRWLGPAGLAALVLVVAACANSSGSGSSSSSPSPAPAASASGTALKTAKVMGTTVLTNAKGFTLYWFALDTSTTSKCNGSCAQAWLPVPAPATAGTGVTGKIGMITRSDGSKQATYNGHPLYTFTGDTAPGQDKGNGITLSGGVWHEVTASGTSAPAGGGASSSSSGGSGYGY